MTWDGTKAGDINPTLKAVYRGQSLYKLVGLVDDRYPKTFNKARALKGYKIQFIARDGYKVTISSKTIVGKSGWIVACLKDGMMLSADEGPYRYVGLVHQAVLRQAVGPSGRHHQAHLLGGGQV